MVITVRLLLAVVLGAGFLSTTDPLLAAAVLGALLILLAASQILPPRLHLTACQMRARVAHVRVLFAPQTRPAGPGRPQPRAPGASSCASS